MLNGKKILLGITGSIAAYKSAVLTRLLVKSGAEVKVIMTPAAKDFIAPLTLATLSKNPVLIDLIADPLSGKWNNHIELGLWADLFLVAPASANTIAKMVHGECDNLLLAVYLSARCPVVLAPAMDVDMLKHSATQNNLKALSKADVLIIRSGFGELASGLYGEGRVAEPEEIMQFLNNYFDKRLPLSGKKILVTAGPTCEAIDPVRFIGNHSSGKMGFAIAEEAAKLGADVTLITGPVSLNLSVPAIKRINVNTAKEMYSACTETFPDSDAAIMAAAVADYTPAYKENKKLKKTKKKLVLELHTTKDILDQLGKMKKKGQLLIGFALETDNEKENAVKKLKNKNLDFIVLNSLRDTGAGFSHDTNKISIIDKSLNTMEYELKSKADTAKDILAALVEQMTIQQTG